MRKTNKILMVLAAFVFLFFVSSILSAQSWVASAKRLFENDEYQKVIELTEKYKKDNLAAMFLAFSHLQENVFNKTKYDIEKFKAYRMMLEAKLSINDINNLLYFINLKDKPVVIKEARKLCNKTFKGINAIEDVPRLLTFLKSEDEESKKMALATITRIIAPKRKYVSDGGTMRAKDIQVMSSKDLITSLLENITQSHARKALELIGEPVLQYTPLYAGIETTKLETKINKNIAKMKKKYPDSNWYSATGKTR